MRELKKYDVECMKPVYAELDPEKNKYITETAGFVPLEVKLKRFEEAGIQMQFQNGEFTSTDYRNMYLNPDFEITPEDDFEDIQEKLAAREAFIAELKKKRSEASPGSQEPDKSGEKSSQEMPEQQLEE